MTQISNAPLTARSVLASTLLGAEPPMLPVAYLVHVAALFGINGNRARVALSRMVASGEATTDGAGRYRLAGHLLERQARQQASREGRTRPWDGTWRMVVVVAPARSAEARAGRRRAMALARMGELREGVWLRPDNLEGPPAGAGEPDLVGLDARPGDDPAALAARLWDLDGWRRRADALLGALDTSTPSGPDDLAAGFELSAAVLRHFQADPLLPGELLPPRWPGDRLRHRYRGWDRRYREVLARWSRSG
jgi:phenylacetic acid degradation operon negative regulatory protein